MTAEPRRKDHAGHRARLKARFALEPLALADYEILELLLGYVLIRKDTKPLAKNLLKRFGSLRGVMDARQDELESVTGVGPGLSVFWRLLREFTARCEEGPVRKREELATPQAVAHRARRRLTGCPYEECWVALVDRGNRLLSWERLSRGTMEHVFILPRDVLETALRWRAWGIILVHNHPGGSTWPSQKDILLTSELRRLSPHMGVRFIDHVIVTEDACYSMTEDRLFR
mgnify:FL=1